MTTVLSDGRVRLLRAAAGTADGAPARGFAGDAPVVLEAVFLADAPLRDPILELELRTDGGRLVLAGTCRAAGEGRAVTVRGRLRLGPAPGDYYVTLLLRDGEGRPCCRAVNALGLVLLPGSGTGSPGLEAELRLSALAPAAAAPTVETPAPVGDWPAVLHLTHWKAGSQWLRRIMAGVAQALSARHGIADPLVAPPPSPAAMRGAAIVPGRFYTPLYLTRRQFDALRLPAGGARAFVVIRDLRDSLVSAYFSQLCSHRADDSEDVRISRARLAALDREAGLMHVLERFLPGCADIQWSWLGSGLPLLRYEELLDADVARLVPLFAEYAGLPLPEAELARIVAACRFEALTGGRPRGQEDLGAHERRGVAGDWRRHFTPRLTAACKALYGDLLIAAGYERDEAWAA